jgi:hypothetical protein
MHGIVSECQAFFFIQSLLPGYAYRWVRGYETTSYNNSIRCIGLTGEVTGNSTY